jgi:hypothetical protein
VWLLLPAVLRHAAAASHVLLRRVEGVCGVVRQALLPLVLLLMLLPLLLVLPATVACASCSHCCCLVHLHRLPLLLVVLLVVCWVSSILVRQVLQLVV